MRRIDHATMGIDANGSGKNGFVEVASGTQRAGTVITPQFLNDLQEELINVVLAAGLTPSSSRTQLADAIAIAATGSASANAISIRGTAVTTATPTNGMVIQHNGTSYLPALLTNTNVAAGAAVAVAKLANGSNTQVLKTVGSTPTWGAVDSLQGYTVNNTVPSSGNALTFNGSAWAPGTISNSGISNAAGIVASKFAPGAVGQRLAVDNGAPGVAWYDAVVRANSLPALSQNLVVAGLEQATTVLLTSGGSAYALGGLSHVAAGTYDAKILVNFDVNALTLKHQDALSLSGNRFYIYPSSADLVIPPGKFVVISCNVGGPWQVFST